LLSKIWTKIDLLKPLSRTGLDHGIHCPHPLLAPSGLKVSAAAAAEAVLAEKAVLMAEALADVVLVMTLQRQMQTTADDKQQSSIG
jgi:hypothetical protein